MSTPAATAVATTSTMTRPPRAPPGRQESKEERAAVHCERNAAIVSDCLRELARVCGVADYYTAPELVQERVRQFIAAAPSRVPNCEPVRDASTPRVWW